MKALLLTGYGDLAKNLTFGEIDKPTPSKNQVLIEIHAAATNPVDYKMINGNIKTFVKLEMPSTLGFDLTGTIVDKGSDVRDFEIGDEVYGVLSSKIPGSFAEYIAVDTDLITLKPKNLSFEEAAGIPLVGLTVFQAFKKVNLKTGNRILIHAGSGGVGSFAIQYAKAIGAYVYTTTSTKNAAWVKELGADRVIDYTKENYQDIAQEVDVVFDTLGEDFTKEAFKVVKKRGTVMSIVGSSIDDETAKEFGFNKLIRFLVFLMRWKLTRLAKAKSAHYKTTIMLPNMKQLDEITQLIENQTIRPILDKPFSFPEAIDALRHQESGRAKGKIIIQIKG